MPAYSVDEIQARIAAIVDENEDTTDIESTDYSLRLKYINMALHEWQETWPWQALYKEYNSLISTANNNASVALPTDFRKNAGPVLITWDGTTTDAFADTRPQEANEFDSSMKRVEFLGNYKNNYTLRVYGVTLASGASVKVPYYASVQSLVSPANLTEIPNIDYLVKRVVAYWWEAREDTRYPAAKAEAEKILRNMIEYENVFGDSANYSRIKTLEERKGFQWGRD